MTAIIRLKAKIKGVPMPEGTDRFLSLNADLVGPSLLLRFDNDEYGNLFEEMIKQQHAK